MVPRRLAAISATVTLLSGCGGGGASPPPDPLAHLAPTGELTLSPGNAAGQDEDPSILRAIDGSLYAAWYSNRNGVQPDGVEDKEIFLARSTDGLTWTDPPVQVTRHARFAFFPSLAQDGAGAFHLAWWRVIPTPEGCVPGVDCDGGTVNRIVYKSSANGLDWDLDQETTIAGGPGDFLPTIVHDRVADRLLVYFVSVARNAAGAADLADRTLRIYVAVNDGSGWAAPRRLTGVNPDTSHNTFPHVAQAADGRFLMTWTRYDVSAPSDVLQVLREPSTDTMLATSIDGLDWSAPAVMSDDDAEPAIDVLPSLYANPAADTWNVVWRTTAGGVTTGATVELPAGGAYPADLVPRPGIAGYSGRVAATATPGIFWAAWVNGPTGREKIRHGFFAR